MVRRWLAAMAMVAMLAACGGVEQLVAATSPAHGANPDQPVVRNALDLLQDGIGSHRLVLLGEMHGTREIPALTGDLAERYARSGEQVVLALEMAESEHGRVDRYLDSPGAGADRVALLSGWHWREPMHDGRDSEAMLELIEHMRVLRAQGNRVRIVLFDPGDTRDDRDRGMARRLRAAAAEYPQARLLVLTGNVHAMTRAPQNLVLDGKPYEPMTAGRLLEDLDPLSIRFAARTGESVACLHGRCAVQPYSGPAAASAPAYALESSPQSPWDATLTLQRFTASPAAILEGSENPVEPSSQ